MICHPKIPYAAAALSFAMCSLVFAHQVSASIVSASGTLLARSSSGPDEAPLEVGSPTLVESFGNGNSPVGSEVSFGRGVLHSLGAGIARFETEISAWTRTNNLGVVNYKFTIDESASLVVRASSETRSEGSVSNSYVAPSAWIGGNGGAQTHNFGHNTTGERIFNLGPGTYEMVLTSAGISGGGIDGVTFAQYDFDTLFEWGIGGLAGQDPDTPILPTDLDPGVFTFDAITSTDLVFYDPVIATGYRYEADDVAFASVLVPDALPGGDDLFELVVGEDSYLLNAGQEFDFTTLYSDGVYDFTILGIDPGEGLDPNDPTAFVTGLSFVEANQRNRFTMSALSSNPVPEPATIAVWTLIGICGVGYGVRRRKRRAA